MPAGIMDIEIEQGSTYSVSIDYEQSPGVPFDLTGYAGRGQIKTSAKSDTILASFVVEIPEPLLGKITIELPATALEAIKFKGDSYADKTKAVYDVELYNATNVIRLLNGFANISPEVTK